MIDDLVTRGRERALPDVHLACRVSPDAAGGQCGSAPDGHRGSRSVSSDDCERQVACEAKKRRRSARATAWARSVSVTPQRRLRRRESGSIMTGSGERRSTFSPHPTVRARDLARLWPEAAAIDGGSSPRSRSMRSMPSISSVRARDIASSSATRRSPSRTTSTMRRSRVSRTRSGKSCRRFGPGHVGQAGRIDGMTPAALTLLMAAIAEAGPLARRSRPVSVDRTMSAGSSSSRLVFHVKQPRLSTPMSALLGRWQAVKNLVAPSTLAEVWSRPCPRQRPASSARRRRRHIGRSRQRRRVSRHGPGDPGGGQGGHSMHLVESNSRKAAFLMEVARVTGVAGDRVIRAHRGGPSASARLAGERWSPLGHSHPLADLLVWQRRC